MYTGPWGQDFVKTVQREGGKVTIDDWSAIVSSGASPARRRSRAIGSSRPACRANAAYNILCRPSIWRRS